MKVACTTYLGSPGLGHDLRVNSFSQVLTNLALRGYKRCMSCMGTILREEMSRKRRYMLGLHLSYAVSLDMKS